jgi:hypothetical protein
MCTVIGCCSWDTRALRWMHTLRATGYDGNIVLFVTRYENEKLDLDKYRKVYDIDIREITVTSEFWGLHPGVNCPRWAPIVEYLKTIDDFVIITDVTDVAFQSNPMEKFFNRMSLSTFGTPDDFGWQLREDVHNKIVVHPEGMMIKDNPCNLAWLSYNRQLVNNKPLFDKLVTFPVICTGVWAAHSKSALPLAEYLRDNRSKTFSDQSDMAVYMFEHMTDFNIMNNAVIVHLADNMKNSQIKDGKLFFGECEASIVHANGSTKEILEKLFPLAKYKLIEKQLQFYNLTYKKGELPEIVTAMISTKGRIVELASSLSSILCQTRMPDIMFLYDDNADNAVVEQPTIKMLFNYFLTKNCPLNIMKGSGAGQVANHQHCKTNATTDYIWRMDDDDVAESNVLAELLKVMHDNPKAGAVGCLVRQFGYNPPVNEFTTGKLSDIKFSPNLQWCQLPGITEVEHLNNSFLYKPMEGINYSPNLSPAGHREETMFTHKYHMKGLKLLVTPSATIWHLKAPGGGIRPYDAGMFQHDEEIFKTYLQSVGVTLRDFVFVPLLHGLGDAICCLGILDEIVARHKKELLVASDYKIFNAIDVSKYPVPVHLVPFTTVGQQIGGSCGIPMEELSIYAFRSKYDLKCSLADSFRMMYGVIPLPVKTEK